MSEKQNWDNGDFYADFASEYYDVSLDSVTAEQRRWSKEIVTIIAYNGSLAFMRTGKGKALEAFKRTCDKYPACPSAFKERVRSYLTPIQGGNAMNKDFLLAKFDFLPNTDNNNSYILHCPKGNLILWVDKGGLIHASEVEEYKQADKAGEVFHGKPRFSVKCPVCNNQDCDELLYRPNSEEYAKILGGGGLVYGCNNCINERSDNKINDIYDMLINSCPECGNSYETLYRTELGRCVGCDKCVRKFQPDPMWLGAYVDVNSDYEPNYRKERLEYLRKKANNDSN